MDSLVIRTAVPFGYLIIAILFLVAFALSLIAAIRSVRAWPAKKSQLALSSGLIAFLCLVILANLTQDEIAPNPLVVGNEPLVGIWKNGDSQLTLLNDGRYSCFGAPCNEIGSNGHWCRFEDFEIDLVPATRLAVRWRITKNISKSSYQLVAGAPDDPDLGEGEVAFTRAINP